VSVPFRSVAIEFASSGGSRNWTNKQQGEQPVEARTTTQSLERTNIHNESSLCAALSGREATEKGNHDEGHYPRSAINLDINCSWGFWADSLSELVSQTKLELERYSYITRSYKPQQDYSYENHADDMWRFCIHTVFWRGRKCTNSS